MIPFKKLTLAATVGGLMAAGGAAQAATVSYSLYSGLTTNGWRLANGSGAGPWSNGNPNYAGTLPSAWYVGLGQTDSGTVQSADLPTTSMLSPSMTHLDEGTGENVAGRGLTVGARAWKDGYSPCSSFGPCYNTNPGPNYGQTTTLGSGNNGSVSPIQPGFYSNWGHNSDFGVFRLTSAANVTITMSSDLHLQTTANLTDLSALKPGFTIWQNWATSGTGDRHLSYPNNGGVLAGGPSPFNTSNLVYKGFAEGTQGTSTTAGVATLSMFLPAGDYTMVMGGANGNIGGTTLNYKVTFETTAVPLPAAVWLFGSALAGMGVIGRRKMAVAAA